MTKKISAKSMVMKPMFRSRKEKPDKGKGSYKRGSLMEELEEGFDHLRISNGVYQKDPSISPEPSPEEEFVEKITKEIMDKGVLGDMPRSTYDLLFEIRIYFRTQLSKRKHAKQY